MKHNEMGDQLFLFFRHVLTLYDSKRLENALEVLQNWSKK